MLAAALVVADGLGNGFARATRQADLPDVIVRFDPESAPEVSRRIAALPDLAGYTLRQEATNVGLSANQHQSTSAAVEIVGPGRRGYALVAGHDLSGRPNQILIERGLAVAWAIRLGQTVQVDGLPPQTVVGFTESPDNVSYPLAVPRVYIPTQTLNPAPDRVNLAEIWLRDPRYLDQVLVQARATSYGVQGLRFITRSGVRVLLDQAAGIVIDLLVALSLIALLTAALLLGASARAEVQRRLPSIGLKRAVGASRAHLAATQALEAALIALPAATAGVLAGALATSAPSARLLVLLNEPSPGTALIAPLTGVWALAIAIPTLAAALPAWRAAGRPAVELLNGSELKATTTHGRVATRHAGLTILGARLGTARRARLTATATALGVSAGFVLLLLALASALTSLETDPGALGKRYQLTAELPASQASRVKSIPGVQAVAPRYEDQAVDSFNLGETIDVIAYPGDHTTFEAPPLISGRRLATQIQAEVGAGLADALGLDPGSTLAIELPSGTELRLTVSGVVGSLDHDGRVAYVPARALLGADPAAPETLAIKTRPGANQAAVEAALGATAAPAAGATAKGVPLVRTLKAILRAVAVVDGLVCLYALIQSCALTVQERRRTIATIRALGAARPAVTRLLAGSALALIVPAAAVGIVLEELALGPALSHLAAGYATLPLAATPPEIAAVLAGLLATATVAVLWVARQATRQSVVAGLAAP